MNILFLAPHPYYIDRGTPIDDDLMLRVLSERGYPIDLLTYHEGRDVAYPNLRIYRIPKPFGITNVEPGLSWKKIVCDLFFFFSLISMLFRKKYHLIHAVEESVFMAMIIKAILKTPYLYDMDSSVAEQTAETLKVRKPIADLLFGLEKLAVRNSLAVIPVCKALAEEVRKYDANKKLFLLEDISILDLKQEKAESQEELLPYNTYLMYTGNMETMQGIDLLLDSFKKSLQKQSLQILILIGGSDENIHRYQEKTKRLGIAEKVYFWGRKPVYQMGSYLSRADILVSPRLHGKHTPMKVYSYLHSGKAVIATRIASHTQTLTEETVMFADPTVESLSEAILKLVEDKSLRKKLGEAGKRYAEKNHSFHAYRKKIHEIYDWVQIMIENAGKEARRDQNTSHRGNGIYR